MKALQPIILRVASLLALTALQGTPSDPLGHGFELLFSASVNAPSAPDLVLSNDNPSNRPESSSVNYHYSPGARISFHPPGHPAIPLFLNDNFWVQPENAYGPGHSAGIAFETNYEKLQPVTLGSLSLAETNALNHDIQGTRDVINRQVAILDFGAKFPLHEKSGLETGFGFYKRDFLAHDFLDQESLGIPVNFYYNFSHKLDLTAGYRFRETHLDHQFAMADSFFNAGLRGKFAPGLQGDLQFGLLSRTVNGLPETDSSLAFLSHLRWSATPKTTLAASLKRDFTTGGKGASIEEKAASIAVIYTFSPLVYTNLNITYGKAAYKDGSGRRDNYFNAGLSVSYTPRDFFRLTAGYLYQENDSSRPGFSFQNGVINLSAALRY